MLLTPVVLFAAAAAAEPVLFEAEYDGGDGLYQIKGYRPSGGGSHPVYMYVQGTWGELWSPDAELYARYMAEHGVVGASLGYAIGGYPLLCSGFERKAESIYSGERAGSALSVLCALDFVNCTAGVTTSGLSQGAQITSLAQRYAPAGMIKGVYQIGGGYKFGAGNGYNCMRYENLGLDKSRIRSGAGENDGYFGNNFEGVVEQQVVITGHNCSSPTQNCLDADGSGWTIVLASETGTGGAGHCYQFITAECFPQAPGEVYATTDAVWGMKANLDWLVSRCDVGPQN